MLASVQSLRVWPQAATSGKSLAKLDFGTLTKDLTSLSSPHADLGVLEPKSLQAFANSTTLGVGAQLLGGAAAGATVGAMVGAAVGGIGVALGNLALLQPVASGESPELGRLKKFARSLNGGEGPARISEHQGYVIVGGTRVRRRAALSA